MLSSTSRSLKPKLSLSISTAASSTATHSSTRPSLSLKSPMSLSIPSVPTPRTPISPSPISPTARNTRLNQRGYSTMHVQQPTFAYANFSSERSILKKGSSASSASSGASGRRLQFRDEPTVYSVTPLEFDDVEGDSLAASCYGGDHAKMKKEERRWGSRR